jgi:hypothetical protein
MVSKKSSQPLLREAYSQQVKSRQRMKHRYCTSWEWPPVLAACSYNVFVGNSRALSTGGEENHSWRQTSCYASCCDDAESDMGCNIAVKVLAVSSG